MEIHLFGAATTTGAKFSELLYLKEIDWKTYKYTRDVRKLAQGYCQVDLDFPERFVPPGIPECAKIYINFAPIWKVSQFLRLLASDFPEKLEGLSGLIACSSSSAITKRFAANRFDRQLVANLIAAQDQLLATCRRLSVPCRILRPTLIHGQVGGLGDRNLSRLIQLMRRLPVLPIPAESGLRQPIHASWRLWRCV